jgi:O-antigen ligase
MSATLTFIASAPTRTYAEGEDPFLFHRVRTWGLLFALFLMADGNGLLTTQGLHPSVTSETEEPSGILLLVTVVMWVTCAGLMATQVGPTLRMMLKQKAVLSFAVLAFLSAFWSQAPQVTLRKATILFLYLLFAWFFATYYTPPDQMRLLLALGVIMGLASIAWVIFLPQYGIHATGEWKGVFGQKNFLGNTMFFLFAGLPFCRISSGRRLLTVALQAILPLGLILLSQSRSPLIMAVVLLAVRVFGPLMTRIRREAIPFMLYCMGIGIAAIPITLGLIVRLVGRDLTFTGRTHTWAMVFPIALKHLWLGYGYQAFWLNASGAREPLSLGGIPIISVDNGYLDVMLQFGLVGVGLLIVLLTICVRDFLGLLRRSSVPLVAYWYAGLIVATFVGAVTENMFWMPTRIIPFMLLVACAGLRSLNYENASL